MRATNRHIKRLLARANNGGWLGIPALERLQKAAEAMTVEEWRIWFEGAEVARVGLGYRHLELDKRVKMSMTMAQLDAHNCIGQALEIITAGIGVKTNKFMFSDGGHDDDDEHTWKITKIEKYKDWARKAKSSGIDVGAVVSIVCFGEGCRAVERERHKKNGWAKKNLFDALDLYVDLQNWGF